MRRTRNIAFALLVAVTIATGGAFDGHTATAQGGVPNGSYSCGECKVYVYNHNSPNWCENNMTKNEACAINAEIEGCEGQATHQGSDQDVGECTWDNVEWWVSDCFECSPYLIEG